MRTLHVGLRVTDPDRSLAFYTALGYRVVGQVPETPFGHLTMLQLPDDPYVSVELVHDPDRPVEQVSGINHLVVQVDSIDDTVAGLASRGIDAGSRAGSDDEPQTAWLADPDGYRVELVQWPAGHPAGMTADDFVSVEE